MGEYSTWRDGWACILLYCIVGTVCKMWGSIPDGVSIVCMYSLVLTVVSSTVQGKREAHFGLSGNIGWNRKFSLCFLQYSTIHSTVQYNTILLQ